MTFGSASLLEVDDDRRVARSVLEAALDAGAQRLDTAPMYGHGLGEELVAEVAAARGVPATTKVGIEPRARPPRWRLAAVSLVDRMPAALGRAARRAAGAGPLDPFEPSGRFGAEAVRASVERSLSRFGRIDRLLLHEVQPPDVTEELLAVLASFQDRGDVGELGCATRNAITAEVLERGRGLLRVAHISLAPLSEQATGATPDVLLVGHGALGAGGGDLRRVLASLDGDPELAAEWRRATTDSPWAGADGVAAALVARARRQAVAEVIVATSRRERVAGLVRAAAADAEPAPAAAEVLERVIAAARRTR